jgi:hypothetical protein
MEIKFLKDLENNPVRYGVSKDYPIIPLTEPQISNLEQLYNNNNPFPKALKELLYLAGGYCYVLDYGTNASQQEMQDFVRAEMLDEGRSITRPFYVIDVYNALDQFLFVYLDEGDNPPVREAHYVDSITRSNWITLVDSSLSNYINGLVQRVKNGQNPF